MNSWGSEKNKNNTHPHLGLHTETNIKEEIVQKPEMTACMWKDITKVMPNIY